MAVAVVPSQPPVHAARAGKLRPTMIYMICCVVAYKIQYNKLLGNVRITVQEFGPD